jgi:hypothetical protein
MRKQREFTMDDGQVTTILLLMKRVGVSRNTAGNRLRTSTDPLKVFAPRGAVVGHSYTKDNKNRKANKPKSGATTAKARLEKFIVETKPYYADKMFRYMLKNISYKVIA